MNMHHYRISLKSASGAMQPQFVIKCNLQEHKDHPLCLFSFDCDANVVDKTYLLVTENSMLFASFLL